MKSQKRAEDQRTPWYQVSCFHTTCPVCWQCLIHRRKFPDNRKYSIDLFQAAIKEKENFPIGYFYCALLLSRTSCQTPLLENSFDHCHHSNNLFINCRIILYSGIRLKTTGTFKF